MKKKEKRVHHVLSNGQVVSIYFTCKNARFDDGYDYKCWSVGVRVGARRRDNNDWYNGDSKYEEVVSTGRCGLEAMVFAKRAITEFMRVERLDSAVQKVVVGWADEKRGSAYRYLGKLGFALGYYDGSPAYMMDF